MPRYIDADEALRMMRNSKQDCPFVDGKKSVWDVAHDCAISCVDAIPTADVAEVKHGEWISVTKQLPETYIEVLVCFKADGTNVIAFVNRFGKWKNASTDNFIESEITHWMPLPEPPKGE